MYHRLVQCPNSELVYADQPFDSNSGRSGIPQAWICERDVEDKERC